MMLTRTIALRDMNLPTNIGTYWLTEPVTGSHLLDLIRGVAAMQVQTML